MSQPINITTLAGVRLDVNPSATIELNMGGMSLLSLADRTATYTNSFSLPRTPTNERVFAFASQPTRNNRPIIDVIITKGLFQKKAVLKVIDFDKDYKCSINYANGVVDILKNQDLDLFGTFPIEVDTAITHSTDAGTCIAELFSQAFIASPIVEYFPLKTNTTTVNETNGNIACKLTTVLSTLTSLHGITFTGTLLTDTYFQRSFVLMPNYSFNLFDFAGTFEIHYNYLHINAKKITISDLLKTICHIFFSDIEINGSVVTLNKLNTSATSINIDTLSQSKIFQSGLSKSNRIKYTVEDKSKELLGSDEIIADGEGTKDLLTINNYIPVTDSVGYVISQDKCADKVIIMIDNGTFFDTATMKDNYGVDQTGYSEMIKANTLSMAGYYSTILNPIFENPVILSANGYIDPLTANSIMTTRVINSVKLGGRYWVDSMAYNITTGQSKMTLIKL